MNPKRVLQVLTIMNRGGAEAMIMNYYRNMDHKKVQFDFLLHRQERGAYDDEIEHLGGKIFRLQNISLKNVVGYMKELNSFFENHPEYQIVHSHLNALSVFVLKAAKNNNVQIRIAHSHTSLYHLNLNPFSKKRHNFNFIFKFIVQNTLKKMITSNANYYFACGDKAGKWLFGKKNKSKIRIVNNAIDTTKFTFDSQQSIKMKSELNVKDKLVIGHVGNFVPEKNHTFLLEVFKEVQKIENESVLILVGGGNNSSIKELAKKLKLTNDVQFLGVRSDVNTILQAFDLFLFPSTNEGLPVTLIEAQSAGIKIFASDEVSNELNITGLVNFISLKKQPSYWAELLTNSKYFTKINTRTQIIEGKYDIKSNVLLLQEFYYNQTKL